MNENAKNYRNQAIEAEEKCRKELLKEFFNLKTKVIERLNHLYKAGVDEEAWIRLEDAKVKEGLEECYETVNKFQVLRLKKYLNNLKEGEQLEKVISDFLNIKPENWSYYINDFAELYELENDITVSNDALMYLQMK